MTTSAAFVTCGPPVKMNVSKFLMIQSKIPLKNANGQTQSSIKIQSKCILAAPKELFPRKNNFLRF